jgi:hypothetical protein
MVTLNVQIPLSMCSEADACKHKILVKWGFRNYLNHRRCTKYVSKKGKFSLLTLKFIVSAIYETHNVNTELDDVSFAVPESSQQIDENWCLRVRRKVVGKFSVCLLVRFACIS